MSYDSEKFLKLAESLEDQVEKISPKKLKKMMDEDSSLHVIDIRENHEWKEARLAGVQHITRGILESKIESIVSNLEDPVILYSEEGHRSILSAYFLEKMGYKNVKILNGGFRSWLEAGLPIEEAQSL